MQVGQYQIEVNQIPMERPGKSMNDAKAKTPKRKWVVELSRGGEKEDALEQQKNAINTKKVIEQLSDDGSAASDDSSRKKKKKQKMSMTKNKKLEWEEMYSRLLNYKEIHGNCLVPQRYKDDPQLGRWVDTQRENKHKRLTPEHRQLLNDIGFTWSALKESWNDMYDRLVQYKEVHGDCRVTQRYVDDPQLGRWVKNQRLRRLSLSKDRIQRLDDIGFLWSVHGNQQEAGTTPKKKVATTTKSESGVVSAVTTSTLKKKPFISKSRSEQQRYKKPVLQNQEEEEDHDQKHQHEETTLRRLSSSAVAASTITSSYSPRFTSENIDTMLGHHRLVRVGGNQSDGGSGVNSNLGSHLLQGIGMRATPSSSQQLLRRQLSQTLPSPRQHHLQQQQQQQQQAYASISASSLIPSDLWYKFFEYLVEYKIKNGTLVIPPTHEDYATIGLWVQQQRELYRINALPTNKIQLLNRVGLVLDLNQQLVELQLPPAQIPPPTPRQRQQLQQEITKDDIMFSSTTATTGGVAAAATQQRRRQQDQDYQLDLIANRSRRFASCANSLVSVQQQQQHEEEQQFMRELAESSATTNLEAMRRQQQCASLIHMARYGNTEVNGMKSRLEAAAGLCNNNTRSTVTNSLSLSSSDEMAKNLVRVKNAAEQYQILRSSSAVLASTGRGEIGGKTTGRNQDQS